VKNIIQILLFSFFHLFIQSDKLNGTYKVDAENKSLLSDGLIFFSDESFQFKSNKLLNYNGEIEYQGNSVYLKSDQSNLILSIEKKNLTKDSIPFHIHDKTGKYEFMDIAIGSGNFIRTGNK
jgi:Cu/Zn superoxide dismutase